MALTTEQVAMITTDATLDKPCRVKGREAGAMYRKIQAEVAEMREEGITPMIPREIPEPDPGEGK